MSGGAGSGRAAAAAVLAMAHLAGAAMGTSAAPAVPAAPAAPMPAHAAAAPAPPYLAAAPMPAHAATAPAPPYVAAAPAPPPAAPLPSTAAAPLPPLPPAAAPRVSVALPGGAVTVGDRLEAVVTVSVPVALLAAEPRFPEWRGAWGDAEVREHGEPRAAAGPDDTTVFSQRLVLAAFRPGRVELPPVAIAVPLRSGTVQALTPAGLAIAVRSVLPAGAKDLRPRPPAPPRPLPLGTAFLATLAVLAAAAAALVLGLRRQALRRRAEATAGPAHGPPAAPLPELLASLDRLAAEPSALALHTGLSQALRRYLGRIAGFRAPESTTTEIQRVLLLRGWPAARARATVELLRACDLIKFARHEAAAERGRERLAAARRLGEEIQADAWRAAYAEPLEAAG